MIEQWMEENATTPQEIAQARNNFRLELARADKFARDLRDPVRQAQIAATPPHLVGRR
jgi:hypothetical protein